MKIFKLPLNIEVVCNSENTRYGFRHLATLFKDGSEYASGKCCYYNRTWESYDFQSVLYEVVRKAKFPKEEEEILNTFIRDYKDGEAEAMLKSVAMVAKIGEVFCDNQKDQNDWKTRMLKAGLGSSGLQIPEDWDTLSEDEKEARLNKVIEVAGGKE